MNNDKQIKIKEIELQIQNICAKINAFVGELNIKTLNQTDTVSDWSKLTALRFELTDLESEFLLLISSQ